MSLGTRSLLLAIFHFHHQCLLFTSIARCKSLSMPWSDFCVKYNTYRSPQCGWESRGAREIQTSATTDVFPDLILVSTPAQSTISHWQISGLCINSGPSERFIHTMFLTKGMHEEVCGSPNWKICIELHSFLLTYQLWLQHWVNMVIVSGSVLCVARYCRLTIAKTGNEIGIPGRKPSI